MRQQRGHRLLLALVGDSLLEPFWPEGTGIGRGFLGVLDTAWMVRRFCLEGEGDRVYEVIREREKLYSLLRCVAEGLVKLCKYFTLGKQQLLDWKVISTGGPLTQSAGKGVNIAKFAQTVLILICLFPLRYPTTSFHFNQVWQLEKTFTSSSSLLTLFSYHLPRSFLSQTGAHLQPLRHWSRRAACHQSCPAEAEKKWSAGQWEAW